MTMRKADYNPINVLKLGYLHMLFFFKEKTEITVIYLVNTQLGGLDYNAYEGKETSNK